MVNNLYRQTSIAFLLVVHNNPEQVNLFLKQILMYSNSYIYIHVDAKHLNIIPAILKNERVMIVPKHFDIQWGDYTQIQANNYLIQFASSQRHHDYYSLHSGADLLIRLMNELIDYLEDTNQYAYCECTRLPSHWQYGGGFGRLALKWPKCFRRRLNRNSPMRYLRSVYGKLYGIGVIPGKKLPEQYLYYGGADWFTMRSDCALNVLKFSQKEQEFELLFIDSLSGAEIYYVSIFEMTKGDCALDDKNMLRYIDWEDRGQILSVGSPNTCMMEFVKDIENSQAFFARKFDLNIDSAIVEYFCTKTGVIS